MSAAPPLARSRRRAALAGVLCAAALAGLLAVGAGSAAAAAPTPTAVIACKGFKVLHDDRIGPASFPAGTYTVEIPVAAELSCKEGNELFARFLEDFDGVLPRPWKLEAEGSGKATFARGAQPGFSVALSKSSSSEGGEPTSPVLGTLCNGTFSVNSDVVIGPLRFTKGKFLIYLPPKSGISCHRASVLFTRFLAATPDLPSPWRLATQTATFSKPANPARSAFRIEPLDGSGVR
jgi:hypothetical protein